MAVELTDLVRHLDDYLAIREVRDYPNALNGLQVESAGPVGRVAVAVDATGASIDAAVEAGADVLVVHHGLFWDGNRAVTGRRYRRLKRAMDAGLAVYAAHLPLDAHAEVGNNAVLARELGVDVRGRFAEHEGVALGVWGELRISREGLCARLDEVLGGRVKLIPGGPERVERVGVVTGGGGSFVGAALRSRLDALVTGEGSHHTYFDATEGGLNLYYGGHYATETWGVRALGAHLEEVFGLPWIFIDQPTGL